VGPEGELYKCWTDVGRPSMVVGSIHAEETITDPVLVARYATGVDPFSDPRCRACAALPTCGGGCAHRRLLARYEGREDVAFCSIYRTRLRDCLESYIQVRRSRETCAALLRPGTAAEETPAWRVISPAPEQVLVLPIADRHADYAASVMRAVRAAGAADPAQAPVTIHADVDDRGESIGKRIRDAQLQKVPFILVVGDREAEAGTVGVRERGEDKGARPLAEFVDQLVTEIRERRLP
jgi:radical SAM protein with 4Fe4S-binding SPASM domain